MRRCGRTDGLRGRSRRPRSNLLDVDRYGLDEIDQKIMLTILEKYRGGPVGVNTIAASISEEADTIEEVYEPYLIQLGFLNRTPRGRVATELAYDYFNVKRRLRQRRSAGSVLNAAFEDHLSQPGVQHRGPRGKPAEGHRAAGRGGL